MSAIFSDCNSYRYYLGREVSLTSDKKVAFIMVNPSTADETANDPTIRKCIGFAERWGFGKLAVGNLFAYRSTDIKDLRLTNRPEGESNDEYLKRMMRQADMVVCAWGALAKLPVGLRGRWKAIPALADELDIQLHCLGVGKDLQPVHPLFIPYDKQPERWDWRI